MKFSINIPYGLKEWQVYFDILYPEYFYGVELPADFLNFGKLPVLLRKNHHSIVNVIELMDVSLTRNAAEQDDAVRDDIFEHLSENIIKDRLFSIDSFLIDIGINPLDEKDELKSLKLNFFKKFAYSLYRKGCFLTIPVNINSVFNLDSHSHFYIDLITESMFPQFKLTLNISPHEIKKSISPKSIYEKFIYDIKNIRFIYEPETGNYLSEKLLMYWLRPLKKLNYNGDIIIVPKTQNDFIFEAEIKKLTTIIEKL